MDLGTILCSLVTCIAPLVLVIILIIAAVRRKPSSITSSNETFAPANNDRMILSWLRDRRIDGLKTIDELIDYLEKPKEIEQVQPIEKQKPIVKTISEPVKPVVQSDPLSSAELLLYIGAFLITSAMVFLVALG